MQNLDSILDSVRFVFLVFGSLCLVRLPCRETEVMLAALGVLRAGGVEPSIYCFDAFFVPGGSVFEALRQREAAGLAPSDGEGIPAEDYDNLLFEWAYPEVAAWCREQERPYPTLTEDGEIQEELPRNAKLRC